MFLDSMSFCCTISQVKFLPQETTTTGGGGFLLILMMYQKFKTLPISNLEHGFYIQSGGGERGGGSNQLHSVVLFI